MDADRIIAVNRLPPTGALSVGQTLVVPRMTGIVHAVAAGETLVAIARFYRVGADAIIEANGLPEVGVLVVGQRLFIPGASPPLLPTAAPTATAQVRIPGAPPPTLRASVPGASGPMRGQLLAGSRAGALMMWPSHRILSQMFGEDGHTGIDLMADMGDPVVAAAGGVVTVALDVEYGYGWRVEIDHGGGLSTLYAHLSSFTVKVGDRVAQGQRIGLVGTTGVSTGPHLHFEVRQNGIPVDPAPYLP